MRRITTRAEFISKLLKDDLDSGKKPELEKHRAIIENPNLSSEEENQIRFSLVQHNGAFGKLFELFPNMSFYMEEATTMLVLQCGTYNGAQNTDTIFLGRKK